ncbi:c-type cytochrome [Xanthobacter oligotrophicus]|uniref:c-type cytochrome n=1 Tax=Xanthobacter oligotrophicus TaxID=2607286 RepID=UPI0011F28E01|nr:c-type cytochrome [Xanthobacter oligotrophicus]MCG5236231.1 cytochrome c [Xanthobacter oligotrophicus]
MVLKSAARLLPGAAFAFLLLSGPVAAARAGDPEAGRVLATGLCANCHVVGAQPQSAASDAPTFFAIAERDGGVSADWLVSRLANPHPQMPQVSLTRADATDLAAYIANLKK